MNKIKLPTLYDILMEAPLFWYGKVSSKEVHWGRWHWERDYPYYLTYKSRYFNYDIDLVEHRGLTNAANVVFWIYQLEHKAWITDRDIRDLLRAFEELMGHDTHSAVCFPEQGGEFGIKKNLDDLWQKTFAGRGK